MTHCTIMASMLEEGFYCITEQQLSLTNRAVYCALGLASGLVGLGGATWQTVQWRPFLQGYRRRRRPSPNPMIVVSLAVAELFACIGVVLRSTAMLVTVPPQQAVNGSTFAPLNGSAPLIVVGHTIEVMNQYFYGVTFLWTLGYALDILMQLMRIDLPHRLYHAICWTVPALTTTGSIVSIAATPGSPNTCAYGNYLILRYSFTNILILVAMAGNPLIYLCCNETIDRRMRESGLLDNHNQAVMTALKKKYMAVSLIFALCWFPNIIDAFILTSAAASRSVPQNLARYFPLWALEAILNPIQGLLNCLVYGRHLLFRQITRYEGRIHLPEDVTEDTPILYDRRNPGNLFASE